MKLEMFLKKFNKLKTVHELIDGISNIFKGYAHGEYIPAIIEEGSFTIDGGEDFYVKLVLKHQSIKLNNTWLKDNLTSYLEEPLEGNEINTNAFIHNVITYRNYKSRDLYQLNPLLVGDGITEYEYTNADYVNAYFNEEYSNIKGLPVLKRSSDQILLILKSAISSYLNTPESNYYPKFNLVAEFEYRSHKNHFMEDNSKIYATDDYYVKVDRVDNKIYILGSIIIPIQDIEKNNTTKERNVKVIDLHKLKPRKHNASHYNGDIVEGFICFKYDVINILREYYYFYDLQMVDKGDTSNSYLVDVLEDKVVFWEAEYNKLPTLIKDKIDAFNYIPDGNTNLISEAMSAMQLEADWNWNRKLQPNLALASLIREQLYYRAMDINLSFVIPESIFQLREFILKIESLTNVKLEKFNSSAKDVAMLLDIRDKNNVDINKNEIILLYQKYCYAIQKRLINE